MEEKFTAIRLEELIKDAEDGYASLVLIKTDGTYKVSKVKEKLDTPVKMIVFHEKGGKAEKKKINRTALVLSGLMDVKTGCFSEALRGPVVFSIGVDREFSEVAAMACLREEIRKDD